MATTTTITQLTGPITGHGNVNLKVRITEGGSEASNLMVYDNSAFIANVAAGKVRRIYNISGSDCLVTLVWDQTTDSPICAFNPAGQSCLDFRQTKPIKNPGAAGATGDILLTTLGLGSGEIVEFCIEISQ